MDVEKIIAGIPSKTLEERGKLRANAERFLGSENFTNSEASHSVIEALDKFEADLHDEAPNEDELAPEVRSEA
ncbi:hypothetical protein [Salipiger sp. PrR003]|uniref:hypothetical protein n=1 Tax=Salipiger sp. PrR003 TaxID=2706776 RepID=UPI0013DA84C0|nr:hypothetical protein [Salipiger sp. PrR003]NDV50412.1 hypothetical protein [Salipiger sp. PrR003]